MGKASVKVYHTVVRTKDYLRWGTPVFVELKEERLRERGLKPGDFGEKLGLGIKPLVALGSAGDISPSLALGPALPTLALTAAAPVVLSDRLLSGGCWGSDCCCSFVIACVGEEGMASLDVGGPCGGGAIVGMGFEEGWGAVTCGGSILKKIGTGTREPVKSVSVRP
jgi:hypothetical protein